MNNTILLVGSLAVGLLAVSVALIALFDRGRFWDHIARSFVQIAIAGLTLSVAFVIFEKQMVEIDSRNRRQQTLSASAMLRSIIVDLQTRAVQTIPLFELTWPSKCAKPCPEDELPSLHERQHFIMSAPADPGA